MKVPRLRHPSRFWARPPPRPILRRFTRFCDEGEKRPTRGPGNSSFRVFPTWIAADACLRHDSVVWYTTISATATCFYCYFSLVKRIRMESGDTLIMHEFELLLGYRIAVSSGGAAINLGQKLATLFFSFSSLAFSCSSSGGVTSRNMAGTDIATSSME